MTLDDKLISMINGYSQVELRKSDISDQLDLVDDLGFNSMLFIQLIINIEEELEIEIPEEQLLIEHMRKYTNLRGCVLKQLKTSGSLEI